MKAKTLLVGLLTAFAAVLSACGGGDNSSKVPSSPTPSTPAPSASSPAPSTPTPSPSTPAPSVSTPTPSVSTPAPSVSTPAPSVSTPAPSVSTPAPSTPTPDPIIPDAPVDGNLFVATGWEEADELQADVNEGANIVYWADQGWSGATISASTSVEEGIFSLTSSIVNGENWFGLQTFINVPGNAAGDEYDVALTINSSVAGQITFNGQVIDLVEGRNDLKAHTTLANTNRYDGVPFVTAPISIQFGVLGATGAANAIVQNAEYKLYNIVILKTASVNPDPDPDPNPDPDPKPEGLSFNLTETKFGEEANMFTDEYIGHAIAYWNDQNWCGSTVNVDSIIENETVVYDVAITEGTPCAWGFQLFAIPEGFEVGKTIDVSFDLNSTVEGKIRVNGAVVDMVVGDNHFEYTVTTAEKKAPFVVIMGVDGMDDNNAIVQNATYAISNLTFTDHVEEPNPDPDPDPNPDPDNLNNLFTVTAHATGGVANCFTIKWTDAKYAVTEIATIEDCSVSPGMVVLLEYFTLQGDGVIFNMHTGAEADRTPAIVLHTDNGDFKVSMPISGGNYAGTYTVEKVECKHGSTDEPAEPQEIFTHTSGEFNYSGEAALGTKEFAFWNWRVQENLETAERGEDKNTVTSYDAETEKFHYKSYAEAGEWWHDQFFYKVGESGRVTVSFTITIAGFEGETGEITINGQVFTVTNGVALDVEYTAIGGTTISIQLGKNGGTNLTGYLDVTFENMSVIK